MDAEMEAIRGDHRGEDEEEEAREAERGSDGSEYSSRVENEDDDMELDDEDPSDDDSIESDDSDDEEDHFEDDYYEDDDDHRIFGRTDISRDEYLNQVLPLKHNDAQMTSFPHSDNDRQMTSSGFMRGLSNEAWARLGDFLSRNTHVRHINIVDCELTANKLTLLFGSGPFHNHTIEKLDLCDNQIGSEGVTALKPFFKTASSLIEIDLSGANLGTEGFKLLSLELNGLPSLKSLILYRNNIGDEGLEEISMLCFSKLTSLRLGINSIGRQGCALIASLLRSNESSLEHLDLNSNLMDDGCAEILARSLSHNTNLEDLELGNNGHISCVGCESFRRLVCDTSSLSATHASNHTLRLSDNVWPGTIQDRACRKIIKHHFDNGNSPGPLLNMDVKLMPRVISWIHQRSDEEFGSDEDFEVGCRTNFVYQILRKLNVCAFVRKDLVPPA